MVEDLCNVFQASGGWRVFIEVEGRTSRELEVMDDSVGTDSVEDVSERL